MKKALLFATCLLASPVLAENTSGFYLGGDISTFDVDYEVGSADGHGHAFGAHAGYRYALSDTTFLEGEFFAARLNGNTSTGNTDFESYYGLSAGFGVYFSEKAYGLVFGGLARAKYDNTFSGSATDRGNVIGFGLGYDFKENQSIAVRFSRANFNDPTEDSDADLIGLRYTYRF